MSSESWSQYWLQGHKTSFGKSFADTYEGVIKFEWQKLFKQLPAKATVLDLCTGNASLIRVAQQSVDNFYDLNFTGIDYAKICVEEDLLKQPNVKLLFDENIEKLPFDSAQFSVVISNYGIEYSCLDKSIQEAARVLKKGGKMEFVCHHTDSIIIQNSNKERLMLNELFKPSGAMDCLENLVCALSDKNIKQNNDNAETWRTQLNENLGLLAEKYGVIFYNGDFLSFLKFIMAPKREDKLKAMDSFKKEMSEYKTRLNEMVDAALTPSKLEIIHSTLSVNGVTITSEAPIVNEEGCVAYKIVGIKQ